MFGKKKKPSVLKVFMRGTADPVYEEATKDSPIYITFITRDDGFPPTIRVGKNMYELNKVLGLVVE